MLRNLSFGNENTYESCLGLLALMVGFNALAYIVLRVNKRKYQAFDKAE